MPQTRTEEEIVICIEDKHWLGVNNNFYNVFLWKDIKTIIVCQTYSDGGNFLMGRSLWEDVMGNL